MNAERMLCSWCVDKGERSIVWPRGGVVTAMAWSPFYDEDGAYHAHNPNGSGLNYECSRGHYWYPATKPCPSCDYGQHEARLYDTRCNGSRTVTTSAEKQLCPECSEMVGTHTTWVLTDGAVKATDIRIADHMVRLSPATTPHAQEAK